MAGQHRFAAFISYSSIDGAFARRLHRALEAYRVPSVVGTFNLAGKANRIAPVFLDRAELSSGELGAAITSALEGASALVVVCSPNAVKSEWVDKEIRHFIQAGRVRRIFAIIASGEPFASEHGAADNECFPAALRALARGEFGDRYEVVAGDARPGRDGFRNAWLKVAAGILEVGFGRLLDRDAAARRGRAMLLGSTAAVVATIVGTLSTFWFLESQRYQSEARASLLREARSAFELDDYPRAITALASIVPGMPAEDRAAYKAVLDAWSPRFPHWAGPLAEAPTVFAHDERTFLKANDGIVATPLAADMVIAAHPAHQDVVAIDFSGRVRRWRAGEAQAEELGLPSDELANYDWALGLKLNAGGVAFGGTMQSASAGGQDPVLLLINEKARTHTIVPLGFSLPELRLAADCSTLAFAAAPWELGEGDLPEDEADYDARDGLYAFDLQSPSGKRERISPDVFEASPLLETDPESGDYGNEIALRAIAASCGGDVQGVPPGLKPAREQTTQDSSLDRPADAPPSDIGGWVTHDIWSSEPKPDGPEVARIAELMDAIQRGQVEIGKTTRIRDGAPDAVPAYDLARGDEPVTDREIAEIVSIEFGNRLGMYLSLDGAEPAIAFYAAEGKSTGSNVCGFAGGKPRCFNMLAWTFEFAPFRDFLYVGGSPYMGLPVFTLIDRKTLDAVEFRSDELKIAQGAYAGSAAVSPSGKELAIAFSGTVVLFDISDRQAPRLSRKLTVPGLAARTGEGLMPVCAALTYLDETTMVASRGDGLNLKLDLASGEELWRFRLPASTECESEYVPVQALPMEDGTSIAVRGSGFVALLDTRTGFPLLPTATFNQLSRWEDDGPYSDEAAAEIAGDYDFGSAFEEVADPAVYSELNCFESGVNCRPLDYLLRSARNLAKISEPVLSLLPSGELQVRAETSLVTLPSSPRAQPPIPIPATPQCFTGWRVTGTRIEPFDLMRGVEVGGPPLPETEILARCK